MLKIVSGARAKMVSHRRSTTFSKAANTSFRKPRLRISFLICSIGFISGVYGGMWKSTMFSGSSSVLDFCHAAPSQHSRMVFCGNRMDDPLRNMFMQAVSAATGVVWCMYWKTGCNANTVRSAGRFIPSCRKREIQRSVVQGVPYWWVNYYNPSHYRADSGLSPYRTCAHRAHTSTRRGWHDVGLSLL